MGLKVFWVYPRNQNLSKLNISCPKNVQSDKKTCQEVIKLCFPLSKLLFSFPWNKLTSAHNIWNLQILPQSFTTREIWIGTSSLQLTVIAVSFWVLCLFQLNKLRRQNTASERWRRIKRYFFSTLSYSYHSLSLNDCRFFSQLIHARLWKLLCRYSLVSNVQMTIFLDKTVLKTFAGTLLK